MRRRRVSDDIGTAAMNPTTTITARTATPIAVQNHHRRKTRGATPEAEQDSCQIVGQEGPAGSSEREGCSSEREGFSREMSDAGRTPNGQIAVGSATIAAGHAHASPPHGDPDA